MKVYRYIFIACIVAIVLGFTLGFVLPHPQMEAWRRPYVFQDDAQALDELRSRWPDAFDQCAMELFCYRRAHRVNREQAYEEAARESLAYQPRFHTDDEALAAINLLSDNPEWQAIDKGNFKKLRRVFGMTVMQAYNNVVDKADARDAHFDNPRWAIDALQMAHPTLPDKKWEMVLDAFEMHIQHGKSIQQAYELANSLAGDCETNPCSRTTTPGDHLTEGPPYPVPSTKPQPVNKP